MRHFNLFPRPVGEIVDKYSIRELHVSLTQSLWRTHKWGYPVRYAGHIHNLFYAILLITVFILHVGPGGEVSATFQPHLNRCLLCNN